MCRLAYTTITVLVFTAVPGYADTAMECGVEASSQVEIAGCVEAQRDVVNRVLEETLGFARDAATELDTVTKRESAVPALERSQNAWVAYRDAHCGYDAALYGGGSGAGITEAACHVELTRLRIADLMASLP